MKTRRLKLVIAYDGAAYHGWQSGRSGRGVADHVAMALEKMFVVVGDVVSSSRTDSGVHAMGLVAHVDVQVPATVDVVRWRERLNAMLPSDIRVRELVWARAGFHARFDAKLKEYRYRIWNDSVMNPLWVGQAWHVPKPLDLRAMRAAAEVLMGEHDFHAFTSKRDGSLGNAVRDLKQLTIRRCGCECVITLKADGYLYKMCRAIVGTLVQVGQGQLSAPEVAGLLRPEASRTPGANAPAHGLILWRVTYRKS